MESVLLVAPITALEFVGDHLLAGEGPDLAIYSMQADGSHQARIRQTVLGGYTIHGIKPASSPHRAQATLRLCVFGSKGLAVLEFSDEDRQVSLTRACCPRRLHDWIWDAQWLDEGPQAAASLALALGHNSVALYDYGSGRVLKEVHCEEKCILYSAHFVGKTWEELTLISGTVFNQLVIWGMDARANAEGSVEPRRRISGHKGVIFSIVYDEGKGMLASASDDRSLRVWKVGDLADSECDVRCLLVLYGHLARVWCVRLLRENIVSIGEDSVCIVWSYAGDIVHNFKGHKGRGIRAVAVQDQLGWVATGGADSGIRLWHIEGRSPSSDGLVNLHFNSPERLEAPKAIAMIDPNRLLVMTDAGSIYMDDLTSKQWTFVLADENYRSYSLLDVFKSSTNVLCAIGNIAGGVKIFSLPLDGSCTEMKLYEGKVHSLTWVPSPDRCHLFTSGPDGVMVWLEVACDAGRVRSISEKCRFSLPACKQRWHTSVVFVSTENVIVCGDRRGSLMVFSAKVAGDNSTSSSSDCPPSAGSSVDPVTLEGSSSMPEPIEDPAYILYGIHGKLGVTSVTYHDGFVYSTGRDGLYRQLKVEGGQLTVLRKVKSCKGMEWIERLSFMPDGDLQILGFHSTDFVVWSTKTSEKLRCVPCGGGHRSWSYEKEGPRDVFAYIKSGDIFVYQSRPAEKSLSVLKEPLHGREVTCIEYAGKVRCGEELIHVLVTGSEDTTVSVFAFNEVSKEIWQLSTIGDHLSSVRTLTLAKTKSDPLDNGVLSCVLVTAGGRAQIECYRLLIQAQEDGGRVTGQVIHLASYRLDEHWDRMKNKHRMIKVDPETRYMSIRALEDVTFGRPSSRLFLAAACSDGSARFFMMCEDLRRMILVAETLYHQRCVLKVEAFVHRSADADRFWLCSAATDGRIAFWDVTSTVERAHKMLEDERADGRPRGKAVWLCPDQVFTRRLLQLIGYRPPTEENISRWKGCGCCFTLVLTYGSKGLPLPRWPPPQRPTKDLGSPCFALSAHQCGINSLHIRRTREGPYLLASGGDDNSIHICKLELDGESEDGQTGVVHLLQSFSVRSAHAAHVTGLRILQEDLLASASVDQRLTLWTLHTDGLQHLATKFCHVADVSELDCWRSEDDGHTWCALCGQGLEIVVYKHSA